MKENQVARNIVANLYWRWRLSRRLLLKALRSTTLPNDVYLLILRDNENCDWNALQVSKKILYGLKP